MSDEKRTVMITYEDALYLEGVMIWVRGHSPDGREPNSVFRQVELRLNIAVANSNYPRESSGEHTQG